MTYADFYNNIDQLNHQLKEFAFSLTNNMETARALYQETTFQLFENRAKYQSGTDLENWLFLTMKHLYNNKFQQMANHPIIYDYTNSQYHYDTKEHSVATTQLAYA